jgi:hypothetical protein
MSQVSGPDDPASSSQVNAPLITVPSTIPAPDSACRARRWSPRS